jgi:hypothetical protein
MDLGSISLLARLSAENRAQVENWIAALPPVNRRSLLIEVCRALDFENAKTIFAPKEARLPYPDLDLMIRGWNRTLAALLTDDYCIRGIPSQESSNESLSVAGSLLHQMGISSLLDKTVEMMKCGQAEANTREGIIHVLSPSIAKSDHFLDALEESKSAEVARYKARESALKELSLKQIRDTMKPLVFPWAPGNGRMVGYHADPDLDEHYLSSIYESSLAWRNLAGMHPQTDLGGVDAGLFISIVTLLASFYLKHLYFVSVGVETLGNINWPMSLTIWKTRSELLDSLVTFTRENEKALNAILDRLIVTPNKVRYFAASKTPYIPMLIQVSDEQLLKPVSSIFLNPLRGIRSIMEFESPELEIRIRTPREKWMKAELDAMFAGNRYRVAPKPVMLRHNGALLTDIDASVFDVTSGCLAVFQLKWQDFANTDVRRQRSQASNFIAAVDEWAKRVKNWVNDHGLPELARSLQLPQDIASLQLFAIGRQAAHFDSLGFVSSHRDLAFSTWPQFVRLRFHIGPVERVFDKLHAALLKERSAPTQMTAIPHEVSVGDRRVLFENNWYAFGNERD